LAEKFGPIFGHDLADQPPVVLKQLSAMGRYDATPRLHELAGLPTLVVSAFHDRIARPESGRALSAAIPGARYIEMKDDAHGIPIEGPKQINKLLLKHLAAAEVTEKSESALHFSPSSEIPSACLRRSIAKVRAWEVKRFTA
jgi:hypothetical protein